MDFVPNQQKQITEMLQEIGILSIDELFTAIPQELKHLAPPIDDGMSEAEVLLHLEAIANQNSYSQFDSYLGAGAYMHHIPALVSAITSRSEFLTSYTPYQSEVSQGNLQATFEYQSSIAALTAMEVANASVYDGANACAEAVLMALRIHKDKEKKKVLVAASLHPSYLAVVKQYLSGLDVELIYLPFNAMGRIDEQVLLNAITNDTAGVLIQSPNFFGILEDMPILTQHAHTNDALLIACGNPLAYGLFTPPGEYGADIAVGDCQPLGISLQFGGPYAGYMACKQAYVRQLPGRLVGKTVDTKGAAGFVLTLQTREQYIRREKATSNICTNQALAALAALITISWYGPKGMHQWALTNYQRAHFLQSQLIEIGFSAWTSPFFNEFVFKLPCSTDKALTHFRKHHIEPGLALERFYPKLKDHLLIAVTELKSLAQLEKFVEVAKAL